MLQKLFCLTILFLSFLSWNLQAQNAQDWQRLLKQFPEKSRNELIAFKPQTIDTPPPNRITHELLVKTVLCDSLNSCKRLYLNHPQINKFTTSLPDFKDIAILNNSKKLLSYSYLNFAVAKGYFRSGDTLNLYIDFYQYYLDQAHHFCINFVLDNKLNLIYQSTCYDFFRNRATQVFEGSVIHNKQIINGLTINTFFNSGNNQENRIKFYNSNAFQDKRTGEILIISEPDFYRQFDRQVIYWSPNSNKIQVLLHQVTSDFRYEIAFENDPSYSTLLITSEKTLKYIGYDNTTQYFSKIDLLPKKLQQSFMDIFKSSVSFTYNQMKKYFNLTNFSNDFNQISTLKSGLVHSSDITDHNTYLKDSSYIIKLAITNLIEICKKINNENKKINNEDNYKWPFNFLTYNPIGIDYLNNYLMPWEVFKIDNDDQFYHLLLVDYTSGYESGEEQLNVIGISKSGLILFEKNISNNFFSPGLVTLNQTEYIAPNHFKVTLINDDSLWSKVSYYEYKDQHWENSKNEKDYLTGYFSCNNQSAYDNNVNILIYRNHDSLYIIDRTLIKNNNSENSIYTGKLITVNKLNSTILLPWNNFKIGNYETFISVNDGNKSYIFKKYPDALFSGSLMFGANSDFKYVIRESTK